MDNIDKFLDLFSEFNLVIEPRNKQSKKKTEYKPNLSINRSVADLKKTLNRLTKEYKQARRSFKHNKISRQELFDFEWRIFEIQEELKRIEDRERNSD
mgnify:FL=1|jgi:hypothetical protein